MATSLSIPTQLIGVHVVEDEVLIRMLAVDTLIDAGYTVLDSPHADHAIETLLAKAAQVHVLFSDIDMPV
jgi:CheY-like chemotaxis protein